MSLPCLYALSQVKNLLMLEKSLKTSKSKLARDSFVEFWGFIEYNGKLELVFPCLDTDCHELDWSQVTLTSMSPLLCVITPLRENECHCANRAWPKPPPPNGTMPFGYQTIQYYDRRDHP